MEVHRECRTNTVQIQHKYNHKYCTNTITNTVQEQYKYNYKCKVHCTQYTYKFKIQTTLQMQLMREKEEVHQRQRRADF